MEGGAGRYNEKYVLQRKVVEGGRRGEETECVKLKGDYKRQKRQQEQEEQERTSRFSGIISYVVLLLFVLSVLSFLLWGRGDACTFASPHQSNLEPSCGLLVAWYCYKMFACVLLGFYLALHALEFKVRPF